MRHALRALKRSPTFTTVAIVTLALGIGASSALFSVADPLFTRPLPVRAPEELVLFRTLGSPAWSDVEALVPFALHEHLEEQSTLFAGAFAFEAETRGTSWLRVRTAPGERLGPVLRTMLVSGSFFDTLGVRPAVGRLVSAADNVPAAEATGVISHAFWQERYGGDPGVVGTTLSLDRGFARPEPAVVTIVGVAPRGFYGVTLDVVPDIWIPVIPMRVALRSVPSALEANIGVVRTMARLRPGVPLARAQAEADVLAEHVFDHLAGRYAHVAAARPRIRVEPAGAGYSAARERLRDPIRILLVGVAFVLLMACANVAALLLARAASRQHDIAVRLSLGGGRLAIVRLVLMESLIVAAAGGVLATLAVWWAVRVAPAYLPDVGAVAGIGVHVRVLVFTAAVALLSVLAFGLGPALWSARQPLERMMREGVGSGRRAASAARLHRFVIPVQVAVAVMVLAGAGLFVRTLEQLRSAETGFDDERLIQFGINYEAGHPSDAPGLAHVPPALLENLANLPAVESLTIYEGVDLLQEEASRAVNADEPSGGQGGQPALLLVGPRFFETMGIRLVAGRAFAEEDHVLSMAPPAVVSASLAAHLFGRPDAALGQSIDTVVRHEIIGVARDVRPRSLRDVEARVIYMPVLPNVSRFKAIALRTRGDPAPLAAAVRDAVQAFGPRFEVRDLQTFGEIRDASLVRERALAHVSVAFGVLATLLAAIGIAGVVAYSVAQRTAEIGLRMALGAGVVQVVSAVVGRLMGLVAAGVALGLLGVALLAPLVASQLFGVAPFDPVAVGGAVLIVLVSGAVAACVPASRAARRIDPIVVLKGE
jgi:predicted permease